MEKFVLANKCALRISDTEKGEKTIVLIHGFFESLDIFESLTAKIKDKYRVVSLDVPGHGISEVMGECHSMEFLTDTIHEVLKQLEINTYYIAGHSMGGYIAAKYAERYPKHCDGLIMIHSTFDKDTEEKKAIREKEIAFIKAGKKELYARINPEKAIAKPNRERYKEFISDLEEQAIMTDDDGIIALINGITKREDLNDFAENTTIPILCFWGNHDEFFPLEYAQEFEKKHTKIKSVYMEKSGHMCFIEEQKKFIETISEFINTHI